jgi:hypothetical protein
MSGSGEIKPVIGSWQEHATHRGTGCERGGHVNFCVEVAETYLAWQTSMKFRPIPFDDALRRMLPNLFVKSEITLTNYVLNSDRAIVAWEHIVNEPEYWRLGSDGVTKRWDCQAQYARYNAYASCELRSEVEIVLGLVTFEPPIPFSDDFFKGPGGSWEKHGNFGRKGEDTDDVEDDPSSDQYRGPVDQPWGNMFGSEPHAVGDQSGKHTYRMRPEHCKPIPAVQASSLPPRPPPEHPGVPTIPDNGGGTPTEPDTPLDSDDGEAGRRGADA